jgi:hypothetical protein
VNRDRLIQFDERVDDEEESGLDVLALGIVDHGDMPTIHLSVGRLVPPRRPAS